MKFILPPHILSGVMEEVQSSIHTTSLQFRWNFWHVFALRKTENIRTTPRHNITTWNFAGIFFGTSFFQSCLFTLLSAFQHRERQVFHSTNFHKSVHLRFYAKRSYGRSICVIGLIFFTGNVTNSMLHAAFLLFRFGAFQTRNGTCLCT